MYAVGLSVGVESGWSVDAVMVSNYTNRFMNDLNNFFSRMLIGQHIAETVGNHGVL